MIKNAILSATVRALVATAVIGGGVATANVAIAATLTPEAKAKAIADLKVALAGATTKAQVVAALNAAAAAGLTKADVVSTMQTVQAEAVSANNTVLVAVIAPIVTAVQTAPNTTGDTVVTFNAAPATSTNGPSNPTADNGQPGSTTPGSNTGGDTTVSVYVG